MILLIDIIEILSRFGTSVRVKVSLASVAPRLRVKAFFDTIRHHNATTAAQDLWETAGKEADKPNPVCLTYDASSVIFGSPQP